MKRLIRAARYVFGEVRGHLKGHLNLQELVKVVLIALAHGATVHAVLSAIAGDLGNIVAPADLSVAVATLTLIAEIRRRLGEGADPR